MYKFHSDYSKNKYNNKSQLLFRETDSLTYENVVATIGHNEYRDVWLINVWDIKWLEFKVKTIE